MEARVIAEEILKDWNIKGLLNSNEFDDKIMILQKLEEKDIQDFIDNLSQELNKKSIKMPLSLIKNLVITVLAPIVLITLSFFTAIKCIEDNIGGLRFYNLGPSSIGGPSFRFFEDTIYIWLILILVIVRIESKLYNSRKKIKYFKKNVNKILFYLSFTLTVIAIISFLLTLNVQYNSRLGRSTRDNFLINVFLLLHTPSAILWTIYYLVVNKADVFIKFKTRLLKRKNKIGQPLKRNKAIKQLKEAKGLLELGVISQEEYDNLIERLKPLIKNPKP